MCDFLLLSIYESYLRIYMCCSSPSITPIVLLLFASSGAATGGRGDMSPPPHFKIYGDLLCIGPPPPHLPQNVF